MFIRFIGRRLGNALVLLIGLSFAGFLLLDLAPGSFFDEMRLNPTISPDTVASVRSSRGLGRPLFIRYGSWLASAVQGDLGTSFAYAEPASRLLIARARNTLLLSGSALVLCWLIALPLGVWSGARAGSAFDRVCGISSSVLITVPEVILGSSALLLLARTRWLPVGGMFSPSFEEMGPGYQLMDLARHLVLPAGILIWGAAPIVLWHARAAVREVARAPFIRTAKAHGIRGARLIFHHILPAAAHPLIALAGLSLGGLLSVSLVVEVMTGWPGVGPLLLEAITARDIYLIIDAVLFSGVFLIAGNLIADLALYYFDPRVRTA